MNSDPLPEQLADRLDEILPPHSEALPDHIEGEDPEVRVAVRLARAPHPALSSEAVARIQRQILVHTETIHLPRRRPTRVVWHAVRLAAAACLILVILAAGTASVSARSVPGDTLYPVKRLVERERLALASGDTAVELRLEFAGRRLDEFESLMNHGQIHLASLDDALKEMNSALDLVARGDGSRETVASQLLDLSARQVRLASIAAARVAPDPTKTDRLRQAVDGATVVQERAHNLIVVPEDPQAFESLPAILGSRPRAHSLDTEAFIATDNLPTAALPVGSTVVVVPNDQFALGPADSMPAKAGGGSLVDPPTVVPPTAAPTDEPTAVRPPASEPTDDPTVVPTDEPTDDPNNVPTAVPTDVPTAVPTAAPTDEPTEVRPPASEPTDDPNNAPTAVPTDAPTAVPTAAPTDEPTEVRPPASEPTDDPNNAPTAVPTDEPTAVPTAAPTAEPTEVRPPASEPTDDPNNAPTAVPTDEPTAVPTPVPTDIPTAEPTDAPAVVPTTEPTDEPTAAPAEAPTDVLITVPTDVPADVPADVPTVVPTDAPTDDPASAGVSTDVPASPAPGEADSGG